MRLFFLPWKEESGSDRDTLRARNQETSRGRGMSVYSRGAAEYGVELGAEGGEGKEGPGYGRMRPRGRREGRREGRGKGGREGGPNCIRFSGRYTRQGYYFSFSCSPL